jgi:hypothetical protein
MMIEIGRSIAAPCTGIPWHRRVRERRLPAIDPKVSIAGYRTPLTFWHRTFSNSKSAVSPCRHARGLTLRALALLKVRHGHLIEHRGHRQTALYRRKAAADQLHHESRLMAR